jgi:acyl dehydratase
MATRKLYFEAVHLGDEVPPLSKGPVDRVQLARYAGASGDFNPVHVDEVYARSLGMPSVYAPGMLVMGMLGQLLSDWARGAQLRRYSVRFSKTVWPGDALTARGRVMERWGEAGKYFAEVDLWVENQKGELVLRGSALVQLFYSADDENRQRAGQPPLLVPAPKESLHQHPPKPPVVRPPPVSAAASAKKDAPAARKPPPKKSARK